MIMKLYLKWYYGYKNWGDELLLLWLINWLRNKYHFNQIVIEAWNVQFLTQRIYDCKKTVKWTYLDKILCVEKKNSFQWNKEYLHVFWWWEVFSDARPFPYNWWNYLLWFWRTIWRKNFIVLGGIGTERKWETRILYKFLLWHAQKVVVRDAWSYTVAQKYCNKHQLVLYHDFAYDVLEKISPLLSSSRQVVKKLSNFKKSYTDKNKKDIPYILVNVNIYLWNQEVIDKCRQIVKDYPHHQYYFFSAALWSDEKMIQKLEPIFWTLHFYDWTQYNLQETLLFIQEADFVLAARLHVLLVAQYFHVSFEAIVYQEKIEKVVLNKNNELRVEKKN